MALLIGGERRMELPNGITGFYNSEDNKTPELNGKQFKELCFHIAIRNGGKVFAFNLSHSSANFYHAQVEIFELVFHILLNEHYPYLAFASVVKSGDIQFMDVPALSKQFSPFYQVLDATELHLPIMDKHKNQLNHAELKQISYWKPEKIGQVLFNFWD